MGVVGYEMWVGGCIADPISHIASSRIAYHTNYVLIRFINSGK